MIREDFSPLITDFLASGCAIGCVAHGDRTSLEDEFQACLDRRKDDPAAIIQQRDHYRAVGFSSDQCIESGWLFFDLRHPDLPTFLTEWWAQIDRFSRRDQLSINYAIARAALTWFPLLSPPARIRHNPYLALAQHGQRERVASVMRSIGAPWRDPYSGPTFAAKRDSHVTHGTTATIDVVVCVHNAPDDVRACLDSIARHHEGGHLRLIIVDDGSATPTRALLQDFASGRDWVRVVHNAVPVGYARAANHGVELSSAEIVILLNSDTIVTPGWAEKLADTLLTTPGAGIAGPLSNAASHQSIPNSQGGSHQTATNDLPQGITPDLLNAACEKWTIDHVIPRVSLVHGFCFAVRREVFDAIGLFDIENFPRGYGEEDDFCIRAANAGYSLVIATHTYVYHAKSKSHDASDRIGLMRMGASNLTRKHGKDRVQRAVKSSASHPILSALRRKAVTFYSDANLDTYSQ